MPALSRLSGDQAARIARQGWGVTVAAQRLASEHDDTFRLTLSDGTARFLRVSAPDPGPAGPSFLTAILLHLGHNAPFLPVQRVIPTPDGAAEVTLDGRLARMTTFLEGRLLRDAASTAGLRRDIGATLARLSLALRGFTHPAACRTHRWDLQNASQLRPLMADLPSLTPQAGLIRALDRFETVVRPALADRPRQVIHADFHGENLLVPDDGSAISGVLDFGDSLAGPVAMDVGIAACYQLGAGALRAGDLGAPATRRERPATPCWRLPWTWLPDTTRSTRWHLLTCRSSASSSCCGSPPGSW